MSIKSNAGPIRFLPMAAMILFALVWVSACSERGDALAPGSSAEARDGDSSANASAPAWYLEQFPQHPDLALQSVSAPRGGVYLMAYKGAAGNGEAVADWLKTHYSQDGWEIDGEYGDSRFTAAKGDAYQAVVNVTATSYTTIVTITARGGE